MEFRLPELLFVPTVSAHSNSKGCTTAHCSRLDRCLLPCLLHRAGWLKLNYIITVEVEYGLNGNNGAGQDPIFENGAGQKGVRQNLRLFLISLRFGHLYHHTCL